MHFIFDLGNVVFTWNPMSEIQSFTHDDDLSMRIRRALTDHPDWHRFDLGTIEPKELARNAALRAGVEESLVMDIVGSLGNAFRPDHDTIALITHLRDLGLPVHCLSNMGRPLFEGLASTYTLSDLFEECFVSYQLGLGKPDIEIFRYTLEKLGLEPGQALFFDDKAGNVEAAREIGIHAFLFTDAERCRRDIESLVEL